MQRLKSLTFCNAWQSSSYVWDLSTPSKVATSLNPTGCFRLSITLEEEVSDLRAEVAVVCLVLIMLQFSTCDLLTEARGVDTSTKRGQRKMGLSPRPPVEILIVSLLM